jgi:hypothetical protein
MLQRLFRRHFFVFFHMPGKILFFPENSRANIEYLDVHAKFYLNFLFFLYFFNMFICILESNTTSNNLKFSAYNSTFYKKLIGVEVWIFFLRTQYNAGAHKHTCILTPMNARAHTHHTPMSTSEKPSRHILRLSNSYLFILIKACPWLLSSHSFFFPLI